MVLMHFLLSTETSAQKMENLFPWCVANFDLNDRSPDERLSLFKRLGFTKYAFGWSDRHLDSMSYELDIMEKSGIETIGVWLWVNANRDTLGMLSASNNKVLEILERDGIETTLWFAMSPNFFEGLDHNKALDIAIPMVEYVCERARKIDCKVALYNHTGWFSYINNELEIIKALPDYEIKLVYNFHHAQSDVEEFARISSSMAPFLAAVNLGGVQINGPKIIPIGKGDHEKSMIKRLMALGFHGPWGILDHVNEKDSEEVLRQNLEGLNSLDIKLNVR